MRGWVSFLTKLVLAVALPVLLYYSTAGLPMSPTAYQRDWNNFLWLATAMYFIIYLPLKGLGIKNWVAKVLVVLLAVSVFATAFQGAMKYRHAQFDAPKTQQQP